jgi:hypothetical protein
LVPLFSQTLIIDNLIGGAIGDEEPENQLVIVQASLDVHQLPPLSTESFTSVGLGCSTR